MATTQPKKNNLDVTIISPEEVLFEGKAQSVSCHNPKGSFDVLYEHTNFMSMIDKQITIIDPNGNTREFPIEQALIQVKNNEVTILVNIQISKKDSFFTNLFKQKEKNLTKSSFQEEK
ncbi:F0F1 ATP synthase subunit epsilon [Candidatus Roizmanbacteria bacterium]|nr:MAG: F0F1 ATP synthase subunit epsilon [Candidatus Roizmanbacteria bacterium]